MEYRVLTLFLLATQTSTCVAELTGDNVCPVLIRETVSLQVKVQEPVTIKYYSWCFSMLPRCSKYRVELRDKFKIQHEPRTRTVATCCPGYAPDPDNRRCVALCSGGCVHGACDLQGNCTCEPGYIGGHCDQECKPGWYGVDCAQQCQCDNEASCHHVTGVCNCTSGWKGARCDVRCPQGSYGEGCLRQCRCRTPGKCNHVTGQCRETSPSTTEEVTSQVAAYRVSNDEGPALTTTLRSGETSEMPPVTSPERGSDVEGKTSEKTYMLPETSEGAHSTSPGRSSDEEGKAPKTTYKFPETPEAPLSTSSVRGSDNEGKAPETRYKLLETTEIPPTTWPARSRDVEGKTHRSPETSEVPPSIATNSDGDDLVKLPPTTEEHLTSEGSLFIHDEPVTVTTTLTTSAPNTSHLRNEGSFGTKLHSFAPAGYDPANSRQSEDFVRLPEKVPDNTDERPEGHTTVQYVNNFLADEESLQSHDKPPSGEEHPDTNPRKKDPDPAEEDVILSGDDAAAGLPPPSNDLQHLRQVKAMDPEAGADAPSSGGGLLGRDLLSTSCVSAGVAVALIVTAALIVAAAHWRKSGGKKTSPEDSKPAAMAIFAYDESRADNVFSAHEVQTSDVSVTLADSKPEHSPANGSVGTLQRNEQSQNCDLRDSMTSHYDIPPPARASLQAAGRGPACEPIYEEIPGWNARATASFLTFTSVLETSRV